MLFDILNTIWLFLLAVAALGLVCGVWFAIALWNAIHAQSRITREAIIFKGDDRG